MSRTLRQPVVLTLFALAAVVSCGTEPASGPAYVIPSRFVESGLCPAYMRFDSTSALYGYTGSVYDFDFSPLRCSPSEHQPSAAVDDCCDGWRYTGCVCMQDEAGDGVWTCDDVVWEGNCESSTELPSLPPDTFSWIELSPFGSICGTGASPEPGSILAGGCPDDRYLPVEPVSGCYDGAWYSGCLCENYACGSREWTCTSRRDEPRCPLAPEVE